MPSEMSAAEIAEDRYEQIHGEIKDYRYGVGDEALTNDRRNGEARDYDQAVEQLHGLIAEAMEEATSSLDDRGRYDAVLRAWSTFAIYVDSMSKLGQDFLLTGPDGLAYWVEKIDRS